MPYDRQIKVVIPNAGMPRATLDERELMLSRSLDASTRISVDCIESGPKTIESMTDEVLAGEAILRQALDAERDGFDAFIVYCFSDPAIDACRELLSIPVVGPGEAALSVAAILSDRIGVITTRQDNVRRTSERLRKGVYSSLLVSVRPIGIDVATLRDDEAATRCALRAVCTSCVEDDGATTLILGCLGMADYGSEISADIGVPILDPAFIAVTTAEMLLKAGVRHGRRGLPQVGEATKKILGFAGGSR